MKESISIKMSTEDKEKLQEKAKELRIPLSTYIRYRLFTNNE